MTKHKNESRLKKLEQLQGNLALKLKEAKEQYAYQPQLTEKLDSHEGDFTERTLLEIVLWKVNRYPSISGELLAAINDLRKEYTEGKAKHILRELLNKESRGFDLPMASAVLRFACPEHLQIIDQRVYRLIMPGAERLKLPSSIDKKIELYFEYIGQLKKVCRERGIEFRLADRILYQLDKTENKNVPIH